VVVEMQLEHVERASTVDWVQMQAASWSMVWSSLPSQICKKEERATKEGQRVASQIVCRSCRLRAVAAYSRRWRDTSTFAIVDTTSPRRERGKKDVPPPPTESPHTGASSSSESRCTRSHLRRRISERHQRRRGLCVRGKVSSTRRGRETGERTESCEDGEAEHGDEGL
jgi:hypothetical protein